LRLIRTDDRFGKPRSEANEKNWREGAAVAKPAKAWLPLCCVVWLDGPRDAEVGLSGA
jgi:hypothetical protein